MPRALIGFAVWLAVLAFAAVVGWVLGSRHGGLFAGEIMAAVVSLILLPFVFMACIDLGRALRQDGRRVTYSLGVILGIPQIFIGLGSIISGLLFLTTYLWPGSTAPTTWWMAALGPILILFGVVWIREALRKVQRERDTASA